MRTSRQLPAREGPVDPVGQPDQAVDQAFQLEADDQRADQDQPGVGHQVRIIELHLDPVQRVRYLGSLKVPLCGDC